MSGGPDFKIGHVTFTTPTWGTICRLKANTNVYNTNTTMYDKQRVISRLLWTYDTSVARIINALWHTTSG